MKSDLNSQYEGAGTVSDKIKVIIFVELGVRYTSYIQSPKKTRALMLGLIKYAPQDKGVAENALYSRKSLETCHLWGRPQMALCNEIPERSYQPGFQDVFGDFMYTIRNHPNDDLYPEEK
ncbi:uncharacterized protein EV154DRAFT_567348 [Mucor mucedo]|uniref:uncharacterized protein n=1 Tax=Mucor mucedo TaxID=29922 RepID=UPI002220813E|nr:uncharacterized protein EV154DRAFT_567348 [Mucor mucedo]KAI7887557.1 hypothetical protein EV154DRAFT_567348 [Mucor mucedo]